MKNINEVSVSMLIFEFEYNFQIQGFEKISSTGSVMLADGQGEEKMNGAISEYIVEKLKEFRNQNVKDMNLNLEAEIDYHITNEQKIITRLSKRSKK